MADTSSQRGKLPESRTYVVSNVRGVYIRDLAKKLAGKSLCNLDCEESRL